MSNRNVVLILTDQQRYDTIGANGSRICRTPALDGFAESGVNFSSAYCDNGAGCNFTPLEETSMVNLNLADWIADGVGTLATIGAAEYEVTVETPYTLWCPDPVDDDATFSFDCAVLTPNSAMLFLACARNWQGNAFFDGTCTGNYEDYSIGVLESYTIGFNRAAHVTNENQPNASTANVRRIGGAANHGRFPSAKLRSPSGELNLSLWN